MKSFLYLALLLPIAGLAQSVPATLDINWVNPTTTTDGLPLTGSLALTETQLVLSTSPIPANFTGAPTVSVAAGTVSTRQSMTVNNGQTVFVRIRSCNKPATVVECSVWTNEVSKLVQVSTKPNVPTSVTIDLTIL